jgi:hypothetical protein
MGFPANRRALGYHYGFPIRVRDAGRVRPIGVLQTISLVMYGYRALELCVWRRGPDNPARM